MIQFKIEYDVFCKTNPICPCIYRYFCFELVFALALTGKSPSEERLN
jgi:hypothetical protein